MWDGVEEIRALTSYLGLSLGNAAALQVCGMGWKRDLGESLQSGKRHYISKGGRLTLIRSTLSNMSICLMSLFRLPKGVHNRLEKIQRDFLWGGGSLERKIHLVNWNYARSSKEKGGLGIRSLSTINRALLRKWVWRFATEESSIWKEVISLKYKVEEGGWFTKTLWGCAGSSPWNDMSKESR